MNQKLIGKYIAKKRKEKNLTQAQLAEKLNVSNKTISKWENGNCMPDYGIIELLCSELNISISELLDAEDKKEVRSNNDNTKFIFLFERIQKLDKQNKLISSFSLVIMGIALLSLSNIFTGSNTMDFVSGLFLGLSAASIVSGIVFSVKNLKR